MKLMHIGSLLFILKAEDFDICFNKVHIRTDGYCVNFWLSGRPIVQFRNGMLLEFVKAVRKYDKKNGIDLIKDWGLKGINNGNIKK